MKPEMTASASLATIGAGYELAGTKLPGALGGKPKRFFDISIAFIALLIFMPLMVVLALAVWAHDGETPFFGHQRLGFKGGAFKCFKFRSMVPNASEALAAHLAVNPSARLEWSETQKLRSDPRITPLGHILRRTSLDELPQLINVIRGEMSLVGPRPIVSDEIEKYGQQFDQYCSCRPGLTGLWQVNGRGACSYEDRVCFDAEYVHAWSFALDLKIIMKTLLVVLARKGSY